VSSIRDHDEENASTQFDEYKFVSDFRYIDGCLIVLTVISLKVMLYKFSVYVLVSIST